jgi:hypothetical protein
VRISRIFKESRDILGAYLGFLQNYSWQRWRDSLGYHVFTN